jgi:hypothetical protein
MKKKMNLGKEESARNIAQCQTRILGSMSIKAGTTTEKKRIERSTTRIKIPESITLTTLISTDGMASVPIYTTMDIAVSIFLQGIILHQVNAVYGIRIDLLGINRHLSGAVIRYQEARG